MSVIKLQPGRMEVWPGVPHGTSITRWYVEHIEPGEDQGTIISDRTTEAEAIADAKEWHLPVFIKR